RPFARMVDGTPGSTLTNSYRIVERSQTQSTVGRRDEAACQTKLRSLAVYVSCTTEAFPRIAQGFEFFDNRFQLRLGKTSCSLPHRALLAGQSEVDHL